MDCDEVNQTHQTAFIDWTHRVGKYNTSGVEKLASRYKQDMACDCVEAKSGSFNMCFKVVFEDGATWVVRFPMPGKVMHPEDKIRREVAVISFIQEKTCIPTAKLVAYGMASDNHDPAMGPFIIKEWINGVSLSSIMEELPRPSWGPVLRKDIEDTALYGIYRQMSRVLLELALHDFDKIGSLSEVNHDDGGRTWCVTSRPMTLKMNEIEREGNVAMTGKPIETFLRNAKADALQIITSSLLAQSRSTWNTLYDKMLIIFISKETPSTAPTTLDKSTLFVVGSTVL